MGKIIGKTFKETKTIKPEEKPIEKVEEEKKEFKISKKNK